MSKDDLGLLNGNEFPIARAVQVFDSSFDIPHSFIECSLWKLNTGYTQVNEIVMVPAVIQLRVWWDDLVRCIEGTPTHIQIGPVKFFLIARYQFYEIKARGSLQLESPPNTWIFFSKNEPAKLITLSYETA